jgi:hypothetical protein
MRFNKEKKLLTKYLMDKPKEIFMEFSHSALGNGGKDTI